MHGEFAFHWFLKMEVKQRSMIRFGYLRQAYFVYVPLVPPYCPNRPHGWGPMGRFIGNFLMQIKLSKHV